MDTHYKKEDMKMAKDGIISEKTVLQLFENALELYGETYLEDDYSDICVQDVTVIERGDVVNLVLTANGQDFEISIREI